MIGLGSWTDAEQSRDSFALLICEWWSRRNYLGDVRRQPFSTQVTVCSLKIWIVRLPGSGERSNSTARRLRSRREHCGQLSIGPLSRARHSLPTQVRRCTAFVTAAPSLMLPQDCYSRPIAVSSVSSLTEVSPAFTKRSRMGDSFDLDTTNDPGKLHLSPLPPTIGTSDECPGGVEPYAPTQAPGFRTLSPRP